MNLNSTEVTSTQMEKWNIASFPERLLLPSPIHYAPPKFRGFILPVFKLYVNGIAKYDLF